VLPWHCTVLPQADQDADVVVDITDDHLTANLDFHQ
jgi:hypothetical protein